MLSGSPGATQESRGAQAGYGEDCILVFKTGWGGDAKVPRTARGRGTCRPPLTEGEALLGGGGALGEGQGRRWGLEVHWRPTDEGRGALGKGLGRCWD